MPLSLLGKKQRTFYEMIVPLLKLQKNILSKGGNRVTHKMHM